MSKTLSYEDNITDNSNTLYTDVIMNVYPQDEWDTMLTNTKFLRIHILSMIKNFIDSSDNIKSFVEDLKVFNYSKSLDKIN